MNEHFSDSSSGSTPDHASKRRSRSLLVYGGIATACLGLLITFVGTVVLSHVGHKSANTIGDQLQLTGQFIMLLSLIVIITGYRLTRHRQKLAKITDSELRAHTKASVYHKIGVWIISILLLTVPLVLIFALPDELYFSAIALCQLTLLSFMLVVITYDRSELQAFCIGIVLPAIMLCLSSNVGGFRISLYPAFLPADVSTTNPIMNPIMDPIMDPIMIPTIVSTSDRLEAGVQWIALIPFGLGAVGLRFWIEQRRLSKSNNGPGK